MIKKMFDLPHRILFILYVFYYVFFLEEVVDSYANYYYLKYMPNVVYIFICEVLIMIAVYFVFVLIAVMLAYSLKCIYSLFFRPSNVSHEPIKEGKR